MKTLPALCLLLSLCASGQTPKVAQAQIILDSVQAKYPGNEHVKPCSPQNHDAACYDPSAHHIVNRIYAHKNICETWEEVECQEIGSSNQPRYIPVGKPVIEYLTPSGQQALNQEKPPIAKHTLPHDGPCHDGEFSNTIAITTWPMSYLTTCQAQPGWEAMVPKIQPPPADPAKPIVTEVPVTKKVYSCQKGWKLQTWKLGPHMTFGDQWPQVVPEDGYYDVLEPAPVADSHPPRCVKEEIPKGCITKGTQVECPDHQFKAGDTLQDMKVLTCKGPVNGWDEGCSGTCKKRDRKTNTCTVWEYPLGSDHEPDGPLISFGIICPENGCGKWSTGYNTFDTRSELDLWVEAQHEEWVKPHPVVGDPYHEGGWATSNFMLHRNPDTRKSHAVATVPRHVVKTAKPMKNADGDTCWLQTNGTAEGNHLTYDCFPNDPAKKEKNKK